MHSSSGSHCSICGLLCSLPLQSFNEQAGASCERRQRWLDTQPAQLDSADERAATSSQAASADSEAIASLLTKIPNAPEAKRLLWVDAADVDSMRWIVRFAQATGTTIHVGQGTGSELLSRVVSSEGWLGTTLSEVRANCDLVISIGQSILHNLPRLNELLITPQQTGRWIHLGPPPVPSGHTPQTDDLESVVVESPDQLYRLLTSLLELTTGLTASAPEPGAAWLLDAIAQARQAAVVLDAQDLVHSTSEVHLRRLAQLARAFGDESKLALLALDSQPGRVTAEETLRWLTGSSPTVEPAGIDPACDSQPDVIQHWQSPEYRFKRLDQWRDHFDHICCVRTVPADSPLPDVKPDLVFSVDSKIAGTQTTAPKRLASGYLFRADAVGVEQVDVSGAIRDGFKRATELLGRSGTPAVENNDEKDHR